MFIVFVARHVGVTLFAGEVGWCNRCSWSIAYSSGSACSEQGEACVFKVGFMYVDVVCAIVGVVYLRRWGFCVTCRR